MNKNYFSDGIMRRMRQYTLALSNNAHSKDKDLENLLSLKKADEITQTVYDREVEKINQQIGEQGNKLLSEVKVDLMGTFEKMREIAKAQISKAPTTEMVNTLKLLSMLDKVSPEQFTIYAEQMADYPLAMQSLSLHKRRREKLIVKENVEVKQTRPKRSEQMKPQLEKGDVGRYLRHALDGFNLPPIDISDIEQVKGRCEWYFNHCIEDDVRPTVTGLSNALGITRQTFNRWCVGEERGKTHREYIQRVRNIMEEMMEGYMLNGKINPVSGIFLMKNNFGYTDKSEVVLTPNNPFGENTASPEELQQKYLTDTAGDFGDCLEEE